MPNKSSNLAMILSEALDVGINFQTLGDEIGVARTTVSGWKTGEHIPENSDPVIKAIKRKSKFLKELIIRDAEDLDQVKLEIGLKEAKLAEILGVSRQRFNFQKQEGFDEARLKEIQAILRGIGEQLASTLRRYS